MASAIVPIRGPHREPHATWRETKNASPEKLNEYILLLERACLENPQSADLRTCLGMAHGMNHDVYKSMENLERAIALDGQHFFARFKYAELFYKLWALARAEDETLKAMELARNSWEISMVRRMLQDIRRLQREDNQKLAWTKSITLRVLALLLALAVASMAALLR